MPMPIFATIARAVTFPISTTMHRPSTWCSNGTISASRRVDGVGLGAQVIDIVELGAQHEGMAR